MIQWLWPDTLKRQWSGKKKSWQCLNIPVVEIQEAELGQRDHEVNPTGTCQFNPPKEDPFHF